MTVYVRRNGKLVDKKTGEPMAFDPMQICTAKFPSPRVSRMEAYASPITGKEVSSWGERAREMKEHDCYDPRDMSPGHVMRRGREVQLQELKEVRANGERTE